MKKKGIILFVSFLLVAFASACGSDDEKESEGKEAEGNEKAEKTEKEMKDNEEQEDEDSADDDSSFKDAVSYMEKETEGDADIVYENDDEQDHEMEDFNVTLDEYALVELNDFHRDFDIPFDDETDGGLVLAKYTVENDTDDDLSYMPTLPMTYDGADKDLDNYKELLPEDEQLSEKLSPDNDYEIKADEEVTGYYTYPMGEDRLDDVLDKGTVDIEVPRPQKDQDDYDSAIGDEGRFTIGLDDEKTDEEDKDESQDFYEDKATSDNMGDKKMIDSEDDINDTENIGDVDINLKGYQFTEFEPNEEEAPRFEDFDEGIVLLTAKFDIDNQGDSEISRSSMESKLEMDNGKEYTLGEGMLLDYQNNETIEEDSSGELLQVFTLDKEEYDKILKDKDFEIELGPLRDENAEDISKGKEAAFTID